MGELGAERVDKRAHVARRVGTAGDDHEAAEGHHTELV